MFKNSPLFIQKILTLTFVSIFFSFLISLLDVADGANLVKDQSILVILIAESFISVLFLILIYFLSKRKKLARIILMFLIIIGIVSYGLSLFIESYSTFQFLLYLYSIFIDIYIFILLLSEDMKSFIKTGYIKNEVSGSFKSWFTMLSTIVFVMIIGAKFLNKYDFINKSTIENSEQSENISNENPIESVSEKVDEEGSEWENSTDFRDEGMSEESDINTVNQKGEGQLIAVRFGVNEFNTSLYDKVAYDIVVQGRADEEVVVYDVVLNRGNQCGLSSYAREKQLPSSLKFGEYVALSIGGCDAQMVQEIEVKTNFGSYMFGPQN
ncbi:hypothetical protein D3C78_46470 [compost metagenome]